MSEDIYHLHMCIYHMCIDVGLYLSQTFVLCADYMIYFLLITAFIVCVWTFILFNRLQKLTL